MPSSDIVFKHGRTSSNDIRSRALVFVAGVGRSPGVRAALQSRGYTKEVHDAFWQLLLSACNFNGPSGGVSDQVRDALVEVDAWDEPSFRIARVALRYPFAEQYAYVFKNLEAASGVGALVSVATFLDRLDALEGGAERKATRKADHAALAKLAERGITAEERTRMRALLKIATGAETEIVPATKEESVQLAELQATFEEWAEVARVVIKRRVDLIRLGLVKRRKAGKEQDDEVADATPIVVVEPLALPAPAPAEAPVVNGAPAPAPFVEPPPAPPPA